jgi:hypothetical protein
MVKARKVSKEPAPVHAQRAQGDLEAENRPRGPACRAKPQVARVPFWYEILPGALPTSVHHPGETECFSESDPSAATESSSIVT